MKINKEENTRKRKVKELLFNKDLSFSELEALLPSDFCDNPPLLGSEEDICDLEVPLGYGYFYQNVCIEHKDFDVYLFEAFTEAVGDIYREIPKVDLIKKGSREYITEKMAKLKVWIDEGIREISFRERMTEARRQVLRDHQARVEKWLEVMRVDLPPEQRLIPICEGQESYAIAQEKSILLTKELIKWGLEEKPTSEMKSDIYVYLKDIRELLDIEKPIEELSREDF